MCMPNRLQVKGIGVFTTSIDLVIKINASLGISIPLSVIYSNTFFVLADREEQRSNNFCYWTFLLYEDCYCMF